MGKTTLNFNYQISCLDNGIKVVSCFLPGRESVAVGIWITAGSRYEPQRISGVSHFLEHIVFKGTKKRSSIEIKQAIEGIGGSINAFTGEEFTCYFAKLRSKYLENAIDVLSDLIKTPLIPADEVEKERLVILEEIKMYLDIPMHFVHELLNQLLWPQHPLGRFISGSIATVKNISPSILRSYWKDKYNAKNITLVATGSLEHEQLLKIAYKFLNDIPAGKRNRFTPAKVFNNKPELLLETKDVQQAHFALGVYGLPRFHPERFSLGLIHIIMGANMSSRLFEEIREKRGLAYEIGTNLRKYHDTGAFVVHAGTDKDKLVKCLDVILKQLSLLKKKEIKKGELNRAKEYWMGQFLLMLEQTLEHMIWLGEHFVTSQKLPDPKEVIDGINKVDGADIKELAKKIFKDESLKLALIAPIAQAEKNKLKKLLGFR